MSNPKPGNKNPKQKLLFKPTPISRLSKYKEPLPMAGDPPWYDTICRHAKDTWAARERAVYDHEMSRKSWPMAWKLETYEQAHQDNLRLNRLICEKWNMYEAALEANEGFDFDQAYDEAHKINATLDYHHDNFLVDS